MRNQETRTTKDGAERPENRTNPHGHGNQKECTRKEEKKGRARNSKEGAKERGKEGMEEEKKEELRRKKE